ncbi:hypothetical protein U91I_02796 [alpha proteobacterium U9-1i]|nr:hypothetical protein U91I_02796 [alpha proteobacterium U9-1i]
MLDINSLTHSALDATSAVLSLVVPVPVVAAAVTAIAAGAGVYWAAYRRAREKLLRQKIARYEPLEMQMLFSMGRSKDEMQLALSTEGLLADGEQDSIAELFQRALDTANEELRTVEAHAGRLIYQIPPTMVWREFSEAEVRIGSHEMRGFLAGFSGTGPKIEHPIPVVERMSVTLNGEADSFEILPLSERMQLIGAAPEAAPAFQDQEFGKWLFRVKPLKFGQRKLYVTVAGVIAGKSGSAPRELRPKIFEVSVRVGLRSVFGGVASWVWWCIGLVVAGLVGAVISDAFPQIKRTIGYGLEQKSPQKNPTAFRVKPADRLSAQPPPTEQ